MLGQDDAITSPGLNEMVASDDVQRCRGRPGHSCLAPAAGKPAAKGLDVATRTPESTDGGASLGDVGEAAGCRPSREEIFGTRDDAGLACDCSRGVVGASALRRPATTTRACLHSRRSRGFGPRVTATDEL